jgi:hypothetical protein
MTFFVVEIHYKLSSTTLGFCTSFEKAKSLILECASYYIDQYIENILPKKRFYFCKFSNCLQDTWNHYNVPKFIICEKKPNTSFINQRGKPIYLHLYTAIKDHIVKNGLSNEKTIILLQNLENKWDLNVSEYITNSPIMKMLSEVHVSNENIYEYQKKWYYKHNGCIPYNKKKSILQNNTGVGSTFLSNSFSLLHECPCP